MPAANLKKLVVVAIAAAIAAVVDQVAGTHYLPAVIQAVSSGM